MRMKKTLAVLAAISMLAAMGIPAGAEDVSTETETTITEAVTTDVPESAVVDEVGNAAAAVTISLPALTTISMPSISGEVNPVTVATTETETTTTAAETTTEEASEEETGTLELATKSYEMSGATIKVTVFADYETVDSSTEVNGYMVVSVNGVDAGKFDLGSTTLQEENWQDTVKASVTADDIDQCFAVVDANTIAVTDANGNVTKYTFDLANGTFVEAGTVPTVTTTGVEETESTTTTTTTTDLTEGDTVYVWGDKTYDVQSADGVAHTMRVIIYDRRDTTPIDEILRMTILIDGEPSNITDYVIGDVLDMGDEAAHEYVHNVDNFFEVLGTGKFLIRHRDGTEEIFYYDGDEEQVAIEISEGQSLTLTGTISYEWDQITEENNFKHCILTLDTPIAVTYLDGKRAGTTEIIDSVQLGLSQEYAEGTHVQATGEVMYAHTAHHMRDIVLLNATVTVLEDGKTDDGSSTSSKTTTSNTTNTPKTGDVATIPAVAVGLTLTAAGVTALIYKKRK